MAESGQPHSLLVLIPLKGLSVRLTSVCQSAGSASKVATNLSTLSLDSGEDRTERALCLYQPDDDPPARF